MTPSRMMGNLLVAMAVGAGGCAQSPESIGQLGASLEVGPEREIDPPILVRAPVSFVGELFRLPNVLIDLDYDVQNDTYLAVWPDGREYFPAFKQDSPATYAARISPEGVVLDPAGIRVASPLIQPNVLSSRFIRDAACGDTGVCLFVGNRPGSSAGPAATLGVRIAGDQVLDADPFTIRENVGDLPSVAWDGTAFRVAVRGNGPDNRYYMAPVGVDGQVGAVVSMTPLQRGNAHAACEGARCLLLYDDVETETKLARLVDLGGPVSDEIALPSEQTRYGDTPCWDGSQYWLTYVDETPAVRAVRVSADGTLVDPVGISVAPVGGVDAFGFLGDIALACADTHVVITWTTPDSFDLLSPYHTFVARVALDGTVLDPGGVEIAATQVVTGPGAHLGGSPIACRNDQCMVAWRHERDWAGTSRATRLVGGTELDPEGIDLITSPPGQSQAVAAHTGGRTFAVWTDSRPASTDSSVRAVRGSIFSSSLDQIAAVELGLEPTCLDFNGAVDPQPAVAASASSFLVAWRQVCPSSNLLAQIIDPQGQAAGPPFVLSGTSTTEQQPAAASSGDGFFVAWTSNVSVRGRLLDAAGSPLGADSFQIVASANAANAVAAFDGTSYVVVYHRAKDLFATRVSTDGVVLDPLGIAIARESAVEAEQSVACGGGVCLVAWRQGTATGTRSLIRAARLSPDGVVLDPRGFVVSPANVHGGTAVAFTGESFVVAWRQGAGQMRGAEVALDGTLIGAGDFLISPAGEVVEHPALVSNGVDQTVALYDRFDDSPAYNVRRVRARAIVEQLPEPDAGTEPDAGSQLDAGTQPDAGGQPDASPSPEVDSGVTDPPDPPETGDGIDDGGCRAGRRDGPPWLLLAIGWLAVRRRRRAR
jgi:hypothetical protein